VNSARWRRSVKLEADRFGCKVEQTNGNHLVVRHPSGWFVYASLSPSDARALRYLRADLRRKATGVWR